MNRRNPNKTDDYGARVAAILGLILLALVIGAQCARAQAPTVTLTGSPTATEPVQWDSALALAWTVTDGDTCTRSAVPETARWAGTFTPASYTQLTVFSFPRVDSIVFSLSCTNSSGTTEATISYDGFEGAAPDPGDGGGPADEPNCLVRKEDITDTTQRALFKPEGFTAEILTWGQLFPGKTYPTAFGDKVAVGATTFKQSGLGNAYRKMTDRYISVPFQPTTSGTFSTRAATSALDWPPTGTYDFRSAARRMRLTISPCYGDFRTASGGGGQFTAGCRIVARQTEDLTYGGASCPITSGNTYFVNIVFDDPPFGTGKSTCNARWEDGVLDHECDFGINH